MFGAGIVGFFMRLYGFSPAALVLGPLAEEALRQTLTISRESIMIFVERAPSPWIIGVTASLLVLLPLLGRMGAKSGGAEKAGA